MTTKMFFEDCKHQKGMKTLVQVNMKSKKTEIPAFDLALKLLFSEEITKFWLEYVDNVDMILDTEGVTKALIAGTKEIDQA